VLRTAPQEKVRQLVIESIYSVRRLDAGRVSGIKAHVATKPSIATAVNPRKAIELER